MKSALAERLLSPVFWKYFAVSLVALGVDIALLFVLLEFFGTAAGAGAASYLIGNFVQYALAVRYVFGGRRGTLREKPALEYGAWLLTTGAALLITALVLYIGADYFGFAVLPVKAIAVTASFFAAYFMRARLLFPKERHYN